MSSQTVRLHAPNAPQTDDLKPETDNIREVPLSGERALRVIRVGVEDLVEVRGPSGLLELRVRITPEGPILQMESVRISLKAAEAVDVECKRFAVNAAESIELHSEGGMRLSGEADVRVDASGEVHVKGKMIYLN